MSDTTKIVPMMGNFNSDKKENKPIPMMGNYFKNIDIQDKTVVNNLEKENLQNNNAPILNRVIEKYLKNPTKFPPSFIPLNYIDFKLKLEKNKLNPTKEELEI